MGNCCGGKGKGDLEQKGPNTLTAKNAPKAKADEEEKKQEPEPAPAPAPVASPEEPPAAEEEPPATEPEKPTKPAANATPPDGSTPGIVSTKTADPIELGDYARDDEVSEVHGSTDWEAIFETMKTNAEALGKEVSVRPSRKDPDDS